MTRYGRFTRVLFLVIVLGAVASCASAGERVEELWRSDYGVIRVSNPFWVQSTLSTPVDPSDGSVWLIAGANVLHFATDGQVLFRSEALHAPSRLAVDPATGSSWLFEGLSNRILHFGADGALLSATPFAREDSYPGAMYYWLTPSPADGSVWVTGEHLVARIDAAGEELWRASYAVQATLRVGPPMAYRVVVDPGDGSGWTFDGSDVVRLRADGNETWRVSGAGADRVLAEDVRDKSVWTVLSEKLTHISSAGSVLWQASEARPACALYVSPEDGSVWVEHYDAPPVTAPRPAEAAVQSAGHEVVHLDSSGEELWRLSEARLVALNDSDGSAWMAVAGELVHVSSGHDELHRLPVPDQTLALDPSDNSLWVVDERKIAHVGADGTALWEDRLVQLHQLWDSANWVVDDGSCWVADRPGLWSDADDFVHLSADGTELERRTFPDSSLTPEGLAVSPFDGSWWVDAVDGSFAPVLLHLDEDGLELSRSGEVGWVRALDGADGSLWAARNFPPTGPGYLRRLAPDGTVEWTQALANGVYAIAVDPADGSAWVSTSGALRPKLLRFSQTGSQLATITLPDSVPTARGLAVHPCDGSIYGASGDGQGHGYAFRLAADGSVIWLKDDLVDAEEIAIDPSDGSAWVVDLGNQENDFSPGSAVMHFAADGTTLWRGTAFNIPQAIAVSPSDGTVWVSDWQNGQMVHLRAESLPFSDVSGDCWAWDAILACYTAGIVKGYSDGCYRQELSLTRDQMAVYISRAVADGDANVPPGPVEPSFSDVGTDHWAYDHIEYAASQNIVEGYAEGDYRPELELTRGQMAVYVARARGWVGIDDDMATAPELFPDVPAGFWSGTAIEACVTNGVVLGYLDGSYHPEAVVTRDQMAVYVARAFDLVS